jgi:hypothetical protein
MKKHLCAYMGVLKKALKSRKAYGIIKEKLVV